jgi:hypothetical protein
MSSHTWTPDALSFESHSYQGHCWRLVEAQHIVSTLKLVESLDDQSLIEDLIEETKPPVPIECRHLHYLLSTPFRYATYPHGSRFRRAGNTLGVYYAAEHSETAVTELAFYRLLFFAESPGTPWPTNPSEYTAFSAAVRTDKLLDLTIPPLARDKVLWTALTDYTATRDIAENARAASIEIIRYQSVRDMQARANLAVLTCRAFVDPQPVDKQTWHIYLSSSGIQAVCEFPKHRVEFGKDSFTADPRLASFDWNR